MVDIQRIAERRWIRFVNRSLGEANRGSGRNVGHYGVALLRGASPSSNWHDSLKPKQSHRHAVDRGWQESAEMLQYLVFAGKENTVKATKLSDAIIGGAR